MSYVAAFRAYYWDEDVAELAGRFFAACPGARQVVLLNEAKGPIDVGPFEIVSHTDDFSVLGFPEYPLGKSLWYNADYAFVLLRNRLPGYDHYVVCESDVAVNLPLEPMMRAAAARDLDAIIHDYRPVNPTWHWALDASAQDDPWRVFIFMAVFSGRAIDAFAAERLRLVQETGLLTRPGPVLWPICESLMGTVLHAGGFRVAEFNEFADVSGFNFRPHLTLRMPRATEPGSLVHPVIGSARLTEELLREHPPGDFDRPGSVLQERLCREPFRRICPALLRAFLRERDHVGLARLRRRMAAEGLAMPTETDLAFAKPARTSSVSVFSHHQDAERDAAGANGLEAAPEFGFHTDREADAWWMVDLLGPCVVDEVRIVNRRHEAHRFRFFVIESSDDGLNWLERHRKEEESDVSNDPDAPWAHHFETPFVARFVRIRRLGPPEFFHLARVQLFGSRSLPVAAQAASAAVAA